MKPEQTGPLESGSTEARYVLIDDRNVTRGHAPDLLEARDRRDKISSPGERLHVVREERRVIPDDVAAVPAEGALGRAQTRFSGEANELDARRPHPPEDAYLYDVAEGLRYGSERAGEQRESIEASVDLFGGGSVDGAEWFVILTVDGIPTVFGPDTRKDARERFVNLQMAVSETEEPPGVETDVELGRAPPEDGAHWEPSEDSERVRESRTPDAPEQDLNVVDTTRGRDDR